MIKVKQRVKQNDKTDYYTGKLRSNLASKTRTGSSTHLQSPVSPSTETLHISSFDALFSNCLLQGFLLESYQINKGGRWLAKVKESASVACYLLISRFTVRFRGGSPDSEAKIVKIVEMS
jgi:hypothetical protein